ncbi:hypothetical protein BDN71DRAFT_1457025 [Pleurotus eryngii]|uniref:Uncharacterized protein n=1 Tax=Pleurotus eryngii TaxID=5323 RepID=A0A9P5ZKC0_PLEER|nr:hypothetical protein BDN71DRAFT_1457025 [Pleurotus eryngii]
MRLNSLVFGLPPRLPRLLRLPPLPPPPLAHYVRYPLRRGGQLHRPRNTSGISIALSDVSGARRPPQRHTRHFPRLLHQPLTPGPQLPLAPALVPKPEREVLSPLARPFIMYFELHRLSLDRGFDVNEVERENLLSFVTYWGVGGTAGIAEGEKGTLRADFGWS